MENEEKLFVKWKVKVELSSKRDLMVLSISIEIGMITKMVLAMLKVNIGLGMMISML